MSEQKEEVSEQKKANLLVVILSESSQLPALLDAWLAIDVPGVTILESIGGFRAKNWLQQMGLGALGSLFGSEEVRSKTVLTVIEDEDLLEGAIIEAERVIGDFYRPSSGLLFVVPVSRALGVFRPGTRKGAARPSPEAQGIMVGSDLELIIRETPVSAVNEILSLEPVIVQVDQSLVEIAEAIVNATQPVQVICVVNEQQRLVGLLSMPSLVDDLFLQIVPEEFLSEARDLEHALAYARLKGIRTAGDAMIPAIWVNLDDTVKDAFGKMHDHRLSGLPIVNDHYEVIGYIDSLELLTVYIRHWQNSEKPGKEPHG